MINLIPIEKTLYITGIGKKSFYLDVKRPDQLSFEDLCKLIGERTTLSPYEVELVVNEIVSVIIENINIGRGVNLGNLGSVSPAVSSQIADKEEDLNLSLVRKLRILFKPSTKIKKALKNMRMRIKRDYNAKYKAQKEEKENQAQNNNNE